MEFINAFVQKRVRKVSCIECLYVHQSDKTKDRYFCLKARDYIEHEIDGKIGCTEFKSLSSSRMRRY